jgi:peptide-methionine (S)-S-oxide reductase
LQTHKEFANKLGFTQDASDLLLTSHVAAKLNGYLAGFGGSRQFTEEAENLGLNEHQIEYVMKQLKENEFGSKC